MTSDPQASGGEAALQREEEPGSAPIPVQVWIKVPDGAKVRLKVKLDQTGEDTPAPSINIHPPKTSSHVSQHGRLFN